MQLTCHLSNICEVRATPVIYLLFFNLVLVARCDGKGIFEMHYASQIETTLMKVSKKEKSAI
mgnify:CR=1 FL=1